LPTHQLDLEEWGAAKKALEGEGVDESLAMRLCETASKRGDKPDKVMEFVKAYQNSKTAETVGWLVSAIEKDYELPKPKKQRYADMTEEEQFRDRLKRYGGGITHEEWESGVRVSPMGVIL
jgi:hypothetical protein